MFSGRFIPACAGSSCSLALTRSGSAVHPRVRGEQSRFSQKLVRGTGSSPRPRARGAAVRESACRQAPVHPHMRGEQDPYSADEYISTGSSPQVRGAVNPIGHIGDVVRFIPTGVGSCLTLCWRSCRNTVHPNMRGELDALIAMQGQLRGSSPRARGAVTVVVFCWRTHRFIPACAGSSKWRARTTRAHPVHPHVRGEQLNFNSKTGAEDGSSPRARGAVLPPASEWRISRFIPTCAGSRGVG